MLTGTIPHSFGNSDSIEDLRLGQNKLHGSIPQSLCSNIKLNNGATINYGCDGVVCSIGTSADLGYATFDHPCTKCTDQQGNVYLGSSECVLITEEMTLSIFFALLQGDSWPNIHSYNWNNAHVGICGWRGIVCNEIGVLTSLAIPLLGSIQM